MTSRKRSREDHDDTGVIHNRQEETTADCTKSDGAVGAGGRGNSRATLTKHGVEGDYLRGHDTLDLSGSLPKLIVVDLDKTVSERSTTTTTVSAVFNSTGRGTLRCSLRCGRAKFLSPRRPFWTALGSLATTELMSLCVCKE